MQKVRTVKPLVSIYDLQILPAGGNSYELLEGERSAAKAASLEHQEIFTNFAAILRLYLRQSPNAQAGLRRA